MGYSLPGFHIMMPLLFQRFRNVNAVDANHFFKPYEL